MNTKNKKCEFYMDEFLKLDKNDRLPLSLTIHLLLCKECRTIVRNLTLADQACKASMNKTVDSYDPSVIAIMKSINPERNATFIINSLDCKRNRYDYCNVILWNYRRYK